MRVRVLNLLITEPTHDLELLAALRASFVVTEGEFEREELLRHVAEADALWVKLRHHIDREVIACAPQVKWIATPTTGLNHIDVAFAESRGIAVISLRDEVDFLRTIRATAELTFGLTLALLRKIPAAVEHVREGQWNRDLFVGTELFGKTFGIVGFGRLGGIVSDYARAFGMTVVACDPHPLELPANVELISLPELAERSDIISIHAAYEPATRGLLGRGFFQRVKPGAILVNTARGEIVDEVALVEALESGRLAGAAVDVVCNEHRLPNEPGDLLRYAKTHDNVLITPHIGGNTAESRHKTDMFLAEKLIVSCAGLKSASCSQEG